MVVTVRRQSPLLRPAPAVTLDYANLVLPRLLKKTVPGVWTQSELLELARAIVAAPDQQDVRRVLRLERREINRAAAIAMHRARHRRSRQDEQLRSTSDIVIGDASQKSKENEAMTVSTLMLVVSLLLALLAAFGVPKGSRVSLFPLAFAFFVLSLLVGGRLINL
ncbi:MAG: hypothetical protein ABI640_10835 [Gammaproteobacteria bacterium]